MYIQNIKLLSAQQNIRPVIQYRTDKNSDRQNVKEYNYNPIAYQDYNITFGRLFRSPQNFYEQDFNEQNMPKTLHKYIYESYDTDFRRTIPPAQAMKQDEVFGKIKYAKNLDEVRKMFPDEPLFANLTSTPIRNSKSGVLGLLNLIKDDPDFKDKTLFKNGNNDLGMYILKKIYIEGKTLEEINKDFKKDISVYYKNDYDLEPKDYTAFGIKFPKKSFWNSFLATRDDRNFKYVYIPREKSTNGSKFHNAEHAHTTKPQQKKRFEDIKDWEIDKIAKAVLEGNGDAVETGKQLKKTNIKDKESLTFVQKYIGEINSVVLEKLHVSPEMNEFFENYSSLNKSQAKKLEEYWKQPDVKRLRSEVMSATIRFFFDVYGVDGSDDEFQELIEYARGIKARRIAKMEEHNRIQAEYDKMFEEQDKAEQKENSVEEEIPETPDEIEGRISKEISQIANNPGIKILNYTLSDDSKVTIAVNMEEEVKNRVKSELCFYPKSYRDNYANYVYNRKRDDDIYFLSIFYRIDNWENKYDVISNYYDDDNEKNIAQIEKFTQEYLYPEEKVYEISSNLISSYESKHKTETNAVKQAMCEADYHHLTNWENSLAQIAKRLALIEQQLSENKNSEYSDNITSMSENIKRVTNELCSYGLAYIGAKQLNEELKTGTTDENREKLKNEIEERYKIYNKKLDKKEIIDITKNVATCFAKHYNINKSHMSDDYSKSILYAVAATMSINPTYTKMVINELRKSQIIKPEMGDFRAFLLDDVPEDILVGKAELLISNLMNNDKQIRDNLIYNLDDKILELIVKPKLPNLYNHVMFVKLNNDLIRRK